MPENKYCVFVWVNDELSTSILSIRNLSLEQSKLIAEAWLYCGEDHECAIFTDGSNGIKVLLEAFPNKTEMDVTDQVIHSIDKESAIKTKLKRDTMIAKTLTYLSFISSLVLIILTIWVLFY